MPIRTAAPVIRSTVTTMVSPITIDSVDLRERMSIGISYGVMVAAPPRPVLSKRIIVVLLPHAQDEVRAVFHRLTELDPAAILSASDRQGRAAVVTLVAVVLRFTHAVAVSADRAIA